MWIECWWTADSHSSTGAVRFFALLKRSPRPTVPEGRCCPPESLFKLAVDLLKLRCEASRTHLYQRLDALNDLPQLCCLIRSKVLHGELGASSDDLLARNHTEGFVVRRHALSPE